jgi:group I intron endonuclease
MNLLARKDYNKISGIYKISNTLNDMIYIGSAVNLYNRCLSHYNNLKRKEHNIKLQSFVNENGLDVLKFDIIELVEDKNILLDREQYWLDQLKSYEKGFNIAKSAYYSTLGLKTSDETKRKIGEKSKGRTKSEESRKRMSENSKGVHEGELNNGLSKLKNDDVILIKKMLNSNLELTYIAIYFNVNFRTIGNIKYNVRWKHIQTNEKLNDDEYIYYKNIFNKYIKVKSNSVLTEEKVKYIKFLISINFIKNTYHKRIICDFFNLKNKTNLNNIVSNTNWKNVKSEYIKKYDTKFKIFYLNNKYYEFCQ